VPSLAPSDVAKLDLVPKGPAPSSTASPTVTSVLTNPDSPDGFTATQRMSVRMRNIGCGELSTGTGFAIDEHTIVTNRHVIEGLAVLEASTYDGRAINVTDAARATFADLAIVRTSDLLPSAAVLADANPQTGDHVTVVGFPSGGQLTITEGEVLGTQPDPLFSTLGQVIVSDVYVEPGSSGSAVLDDQGRVVGVVYAKSSADLTFIVPISTLNDLLDDPASFEDVVPCE
jgi:S1-C subfamily serine protease